MKHKRKKPKFWTFVIIGLLIYGGVTAYYQYSLISNNHSKIDALNAKIAQEKKHTEELIRQKEDLNSDAQIEKVAREKLGMVKHGEKVFVDINK